MPRIIGIDPSLTGTGVAVVDTPTLHGFTAALHLVKSAPSGSAWTARHDRIHELANTIGQYLDGFPTVVVMESPAYGAQAQKSASIHDRAWLWGQIYHQARKRGLPVLTATPTQRIKYVTGRGVGDKDVVLAAAIKRWPTVNITNNNTADAMIFAAMGARAVGYPVDNVPAVNQETIKKMVS
jgi:crossover junction endodeoxyribonuclease RuvC